MDLPRPLRLAGLIAATLLLLLIAEFWVLRNFVREDRSRRVSILLDALATGGHFDPVRLTQDLTAVVPGTKVALIDGQSSRSEAAAFRLSNDDLRWAMGCPERTGKACVRSDLAAVKVPVASESRKVALVVLPAVQLTAPTVKVFCALTLLSLGCACILYWLIVMFYRHRLERLSTSMEQFMVCGFSGDLQFVENRRVRLPTSSARLTRTFDPGFEIGVLESRTELMASAIQESKRGMIEREQEHLRWLYFLCHDLTESLERILSRLRALAYNTKLNAEQRDKVLEAAHLDVTQAAELISGVNSFAKLESDSERTFETVSLDPILEHAIEVFEFDANRKLIELDLRIRPGIGLVRIQRSLIRRSIENLISNALRFTPEGGLVSVCAERSGDMVNIIVSDTGPGIPPDDMEEIFQFEFTRERTTRATRFGSMGLGLTFVRKVALLHGGQISVRNLSPEGSEFVLSLPIAE